MAREVAEREQVEPAGGWLRNLFEYFSDSRAELKKVTWPARKEAIAGTIGVIVVVAIVTMVLGLVDLMLAKVVELILP